jgi:hypothetical protein
VDSTHLPSYLNEFVFRFRRHTSRAYETLLYRVMGLAVEHESVRYQESLTSRRPACRDRDPATPKEQASATGDLTRGADPSHPGSVTLVTPH